MTSWAKSMVQQTKQVTDQITHFFKYNLYETKSYKELLTRTNEVERQFVKYKLNLNEKKDKLFRSTKDTSKWEITATDYDANEIKKNKKAAFEVMCSKETGTQNKLRDNYGYFLNSVFEEVQKGFRKKADYYNNFFTIFAIKETDIFNEQLKSWSVVMSQAGYNPLPEPLKINQRQSVMITEEEFKNSEAT